MIEQSGGVPAGNDVLQPSREIARLAWDALAQRMDNADAPTRRTLLDARIEWRW